LIQPYRTSKDKFSFIIMIMLNIYSLPCA